MGLASRARMVKESDRSRMRSASTAFDLEGTRGTVLETLRSRRSGDRLSLDNSLPEDVTLPLSRRSRVTLP